MSPVKDTLMKFFDACETGKGGKACAPYVAEGAKFDCQAKGLEGVTDVLAYADWMTGIATGFAPGGGYDMHNFVLDEGKKEALFYATFKGTHPPTNKPLASQYVYIVGYDADGKVTKMTKVWNDAAAMQMAGLPAGY
ncbi:hypothetical protein DFJ74DRAFT_773116 [Hyaloraphidium curvatum]|nr:hypothetical protein DFJ74DRAFT_773116 [Hyaloraphidium curvatum]